MAQRETKVNEPSKTAREQRIQALCALYPETGDAALLEELMDLVWKQYQPYAANRVFSADYIDDLMVTVCMKLTKQLDKIRERADKPMENPDAYIKIIIRNSAIDMMRSDRHWRDFVSLSPKDDGDDAPEIQILGDQWDPESIVEEAGLEVDRRIIRDFCHDLMTIRSADLAHALSLMYVLIIPYCSEQMLGSHELSKLVWAYFSEKSFQFLTDESEEKVQEKVDKALAWAEHFRQELEEKTGRLSPDKLLKDTVPSEIMTNKQRTQWAQSLKTTLAAHLLKKMRDNPDYRQRGFELIQNRDSAFARFLNGGEKK